jgi:hypothetical protein
MGHVKMQVQDIPRIRACIQDTADQSGGVELVAVIPPPWHRIGRGGHQTREALVPVVLYIDNFIGHEEVRTWECSPCLGCTTMLPNEFRPSDVSNGTNCGCRGQEQIRSNSTNARLSFSTAKRFQMVQMPGAELVWRDFRGCRQ